MANALPDGLLVYGVVDTDTAPQKTSSSSLDFITFRDLAVAVAHVPYARMQLDERELQEYVDVIDELYTRGPVLPAPPGTVFRTADILQHWLEIHYAKLHEALGQVEQRPGPIPPYDFIQMDLGA